MDLDPESHAKKDPIIMADLEQRVELDEVKEVPLRESVGITSVPVKANTANSDCLKWSIQLSAQGGTLICHCRPKQRIMRKDRGEPRARDQNQRQCCRLDQRQTESDVDLDRVRTDQDEAQNTRQVIGISISRAKGVGSE